MQHALHFLGVFFVVAGLAKITLGLILRRREKGED